LSFRTRLTLFFVLIVVLPMVVVGVLVTQLSGESRTGKADARLSEGLEAGVSTYDNQLDRSRRAARQAARDDELAAALRERDPSDLKQAARGVDSPAEPAALTVLGPGGRELAHVGTDEAVAQSDVTLKTRNGTLGRCAIRRSRRAPWRARCRS
jgi:hypothetical protein